MLNPLNIPRQIKSAKQRLESINKLQPLYDINNTI